MYDYFHNSHAMFWFNDWLDRGFRNDSDTSM